jgi:hypothetical protein
MPLTAAQYKPYHFFNNTIIVQVRYIIIETKEVARLGYNGFLFLHSYSDDGLGATHRGLHLSTNAARPSPEYECGKRNPLYPRLGISAHHDNTMSKFILIRNEIKMFKNPACH